MKVNVEQTVRQQIDRTIHMSLATSHDNKPWVCEVHFAYDENLNLYYRSLESRRHSGEIAHNPYVAGDIIDKYGLEDPVIGLYFEGEARMLEAGDDRNKAFATLRDRLKLEDAALAEADRPGGHQFYKVTVARWYVFGRFGTPSGHKYMLDWNGGKT